MRSIGITELRGRAGRYLRELQDGKTIQVTNRGQPVAVLVPVPRGVRTDELTAKGRLVPAAADALALARPLQPGEGKALPSETLARHRSDER